MLKLAFDTERWLRQLIVPVVNIELRVGVSLSIHRYTEAAVVLRWGTTRELQKRGIDYQLDWVGSKCDDLDDIVQETTTAELEALRNAFDAARPAAIRAIYRVAGRAARRGERRAAVAN